jgi:tetratricopeptide (TPR) repeat protein
MSHETSPTDVVRTLGPAYLAGALTDEERARVAAAVSADPAAARELDAIAQLEQQMTAALAHDRPDAGWEDRLSAAVFAKADAAPRRRWPLSRRVPLKFPRVPTVPWPVRAAAAAVALGVLGWAGEKYVGDIARPFAARPPSDTAPSPSQIAVAQRTDDRPAAVTDAANAERLRLIQNQQTARQLSERGDQALASGSLDDATELFSQALQLDPSNQRAQAGRQQALSQSGSSPVQQPIAAREESRIRSVREAIQYRFDTAMAVANEAARKGDTAGAAAAIRNAEAAANSNGTVFSDAEKQQMDQRLTTARGMAGSGLLLSDGHVEWSGSPAASVSRSAETESSRRDTVTTLTRDARQLSDQGRYREALGVVDQLRSVDPANDYATSVRPLLENRIAIQDARASRGAEPAAPVTEDERPIPHADILTFPPDWPELSARHDRTVAEERGGDGGSPNFGRQVVVGDKDGDGSAGFTARSLRYDRNSPGLMPRSGDAERDGKDSADRRESTVAGVVVTNGTVTAGEADKDKEKATEANAPADRNGRQGGNGNQVESSREVRPADAPAATPPTGEARPGSPPPVIGADQTALLFQVPATPDAAKAPGDEVTGTKSDGPDDRSKQGDPGDGARPPAAPEPGNPPVPPRVPAPDVPQVQQVAVRKIIRTGEMSFEVGSFDTGYAVVSKLVGEEGGYVSTTSSEKLPNGKVRGTIVLRVPPERLDTLVLKLRGLGDLLGQQIVAQDVSKQYTDLTSALRAARAMEERLLDIIKNAKGEIKDLLAAEKELAVWRGRIEQITGELKFLDNQIGLSTLTLTLTEKDIRVAATLVEREEVSAGLQAEDVEQARAKLIAQVEQAKGRILQSDLKQLDAGQMSATVVAEVPQDQSGPTIDRLRQLGVVTRLDVQRRQQAENGGEVSPTQPPGKVERAPAKISVSIYNLAGLKPKRSTTVQVAAESVDATFAQVVKQAEQAGAWFSARRLTGGNDEKRVGNLSLILPAGKADEIVSLLKSAGVIVRAEESEDTSSQGVTDAKRGLTIELVSTLALPPRRVETLSCEAKDVADLARQIAEQATASGGRVLDQAISRAADGRTAAGVIVELPTAKAGELLDRVRGATKVISGESSVNAQVPDYPGARTRVQVRLTDPAALVSRDEGVWPSVRAGLSTAAAGLLWSVRMLVVGLCLIGPWALIVWAGWRVSRRHRRVRMDRPLTTA